LPWAIDEALNYHTAKTGEQQAELLFVQLQKERAWLEKPFNIRYVFFIGKKHDDMVALFDTQIVISDHDIITAHYRTNNGTGWQFDIFNQAADNA